MSNEFPIKYVHPTWFNYSPIDDEYVPMISPKALDQLRTELAEARAFINKLPETESLWSRLSDVQSELAEAKEKHQLSLDRQRDYIVERDSALAENRTQAERIQTLTDLIGHALTYIRHPGTKDYIERRLEELEGPKGDV